METAIPTIPKSENDNAYCACMAGGAALLLDTLETAETVSFEVEGRSPGITDGGSKEHTIPSGTSEHDSATEV
jgi:hypothetical protein